MNPILEEFSQIGIVPVISIDDAKDAEPLADALTNGGLPCAEVTFRTDAAEEAIRRMTGRFPDMLVGAGTVLTEEQAEKAIWAGAKFIVSPGLNPRVVTYCINQNVPVIPGCANPSDMEQAMELGLDTVKFFPAEVNGGLAAIKAMSAPYGKLKFMPTGGISVKNLVSYLAFPKVIACGGSWMAGSEMIQSKDWEGITVKTREAVAVMLGLKFQRIGVYTQEENDAKAAAARFSALFGADRAEYAGTVFAGNFVEVAKKAGQGTKGYLVVGVNDVGRAVYHLQKRGFRFDEGSKRYCASGRLSAVSITDEIAGYEIRLVQN